MRLEELELRQETFAPFGLVLEPRQDGFERLVFEPEAHGWQAALNQVTEHATPRLHRHPNTRACFSPLWGHATLFIAPPDAPECVTAFRLDRPVCVNAGVWHVILAVSARALIFICESADVTGETHDLPEPLQAR